MTLVKCQCRRPKIGEPPTLCARCGYYLPWVTARELKRRRWRAKRWHEAPKRVRLPGPKIGDERQRVKQELRQLAATF